MLFTRPFAFTGPGGNHRESGISPLPVGQLAPSLVLVCAVGKGLLLSVPALPEISSRFGRPPPGLRLAASCSMGGAGWPPQLLAGAKTRLGGAGWGNRANLALPGTALGHRGLQPMRQVGAGGQQWQPGSGPPTTARTFLGSEVKPVPHVGHPCPLRGSFPIFPNFSTILASLWRREAEGE